MITKFISIFKKKISRGAVILTSLTFASYIMGLLRDKLLAHNFGASRTLDIYNASFNIPDLLLNIFISGALSAAFIPVFTSLWSDGKRAESERVASAVLYASMLTVIVTGSIAFIFMPKLAGMVVPGFLPEEKILFIKISRLMLISPLIFAISNTLGNTLVSLEKFTGYGLSPILYNLGIIAGIFLSTSFGFGIFGLAIGTILGACFHLLSRAIALARSGFRFRHPPEFQGHPFKRILRLMLPKMLGQPVEQLTFLAFTNMASLLAIGGITMISFARNFQSVPVSVFGISFSVAVFSALSRDASMRNRELFLKNFRQTAKNILFFSFASAVFYVLFGKIVIKVFLGGGAFGPDEIKMTGVLLSFFALAIPTESMIHLLARSFYAFKDTVTPVIMSVVGLGLILLSVNLLKNFMGLYAVPISFFIGSFLEVIFLMFLLWRRFKDWDTPLS